MVSNPKIYAAIGNFDGVHRGHRYLLEKTDAFASENNAELGVVVFDPHPRRYFAPDSPPFLLTGSDHRDDLLRAAGAKHIFSLPFDSGLASLSPEEFVRDVLKEKLELSGVVTGADFRFGAKRAGDGGALEALGAAADLNVKLVDLLSVNEDAKFGSSSVRQALRGGDVKSAAEMLGRAWSVRGVVVEGQKLGRTLGFVTANFSLGEIIEPRKGVYATRTHIGDTVYKSVSNFGRRPTVGSEAPLLETHLFDFSGDLYRKPIEVEFVDFIRDEQKFDGLDALKAQIARDCETAQFVLK
ncbi:MAG: riboflavin biosynthesis protein [Hyphococcus sp.]|nr:MAG: riboflavin biosynthesis protein [Marinicaulis sp.]